MASARSPSSVPRVVLADDHDAVRAAVRELLAGEFAVVGEAADGARALALARSLDPDVLVLDVDMPELDGFEVATRLREDADPPAVVFLSVHDGREYEAKGLAAGASAYVEKTDLYTRLRAEVHAAAASRRCLPGS